MMPSDRPARLEQLYEASLRGAARELRLTADEARAILDALNGVHLIEGLRGQHLRIEVQDAIRLTDLDKKWRIDGRSLLDRLRGLTLAQSGAVELWAAEFWSTDLDRLNDPEWEAMQLARVDVPAVRS